MTVPPRFLRVHSQRHNPSTKKNSKYVAACLLVVAFLLIGLSLWTSSAQQIGISQQGAQVTELYTLLGAQKSFSTVSPAAVAEQEIEVAFDKIDFEKTANLRLPLPNGKAYDAARRDLEGFVRFSPDEFTWRGKISGVDGSSGDVVLSVKGRALSGLIYSPEGVYEIIPQKDFKHLLVLVNQDLFAPCGGAIPPGPARDRSEKLLPPEPATDDGTQIDVLVVYTTTVLNSLGGTSQTQALIQQAVAAANTAYLNSNISPRLRLVQTLQVDYSEVGTTEDALNWVTTNSTVIAARNSSKADLVAMLIEESSSSDCGIAWVMRNVGSGFSESGFSVTKRSCAVGNLTFAHELGHNEGCEHNPENGASPSAASFPYAFGHYVDGVFRTVMSTSPPCPSGCPRQPYFSNPSVNFNGFPTGIADQRDNHRVINNTALTISQFRDSGSTSCSYSLDPLSRNFSATGGSGSFNVNTGSACSWTAVVDAPASDESLLFTNPMSSPQQEIIDDSAIKVEETASDVFLNSTPVTINDRPSNATPGLGSVYPSTINVSGMSGTITVVQAALNGVSHTFPDDIDVLLVGPGGQSVMLMSDAGGNVDISAVNLIFEQSASSQLPDATQLTSGTFRPTNFAGNTTLEPGGVDNLPSPGPGQNTYSSSLSVFNGTSPNGTWKLYIVDDEQLDLGSIANGWALGLITTGGQTAWITVTSGSSGTGNGTVNYSVASNTSTSQRTGTITVNGQVHTVTQAGGCTFSISSSSNTVGPGTGSTTYFMDTTSGCSWSAVSDSPSWLTTSSSGTGDGQIRYDFASNNSTSSRIGHITAGGQVHTVTQIGIGGAGNVRFSSSSYTVNEGGGTATITVTRSSGIGSGNVSYATSGGTATPNTDYVPASGVLIFPENVTSRTFDVTILDDSVFEGSESINLVLSNPSTSLTLGSPSSATLTISDNETAPTTPTNVALPANGGSVTASSTLSPYVAGNVIDGSRRAVNSTLWLDNTYGSFGDWIEVNFNGSKTISEIDVITQQDNPNNPVEPTLTQTFSLYGITAFDVQYWNGAAWTTVPGGGVTGNNKVWRQFTFASITTTKIRVLVNGGADNGFSRVVEIEAWSGTPPPPPIVTNYALPANGGSVTASSTLSPYVASNVIDGSRRAVNSTLWLDNTFGSFGDWVEVNFNGSKTISEIDVITQQDNPNNPVEPALAQTFSLYGVTAFDVQYWNGAAWTTVPGGSVTGNNKVWRQFTFTPITTTKIRVLVNGGADNAYSRIVEIEAWSGTSPTLSNYARATNGGSVTASSTLSPYVASNVIDGSRRAVNSTLWLDNTYGSFGDWVEVSFNSSKTISEIDVITQQDDPNNPVEPTLAQTFSLYGVTAFDVQYWNGSAWTTVPGGSVTGNNKVWRQFTFASITTTKIRVLVNGGADNAFSRLTEVEAWGPAGP